MGQYVQQHVKGNTNKMRTVQRYVRTWYKKRPPVLKQWKSSCALPPKKNFERPPSAPECTDRAETSIKVSRRASRVRLPSTLPKIARTKRLPKYEKLTNIS